VGEWYPVPCFKEVDSLKKGTVESYSEQKGFGFIMQDDGEKAFFYRASINMGGYKTLNIGDRVRFELKENIRGPEAIQVTKI
jgi:CspA family cold shock protein